MLRAKRSSFVARMPFMLLRTLPLLAALAALAAACSHTSGSAAPNDAGADDGAVVSCAGDPRVDTYVANLTKASASGKVKVTLVASEPGPPTRGTNAWTIKVTDGAGAPMTGASITVAPFMPDHGHPSSTVPTITPQTDGVYSIAQLVLFMPGVWRVTIGVSTGDAGPAETVAFFFCIAG